MVKLPDDTFARRGERRPQPRYVSALVFVLIFVSIALLVLSRLNHAYVVAMRDAVTPVVAPILSRLSDSMEPARDMVRRVEDLFIQQDELSRLREENQRLQSWEWRARELQRQLDALSELAHAAKEPEIPFLTARVVADATGPFSRSVLIDAGSDRGVQPGHPVISTSGLVGRVVDVAPMAARVLLLNDSDMRVPVVIGDQEEHGIAVGSNGATLRPKHTERTAQFSDGDVVSTSGRGGLLPRGLRIGAIERDGDTVRIRPSANLTRLDFVSVLLFESPALSLATGTAGEDKRKRTRR